ATVQANVALIRSIPSQYFVEVSGEVWRAVQNGHDLGTLSRQLHERYAVTRKRAAFIARDQASKANAVMKARRYDELGITEAKWRHSGAGKEP
ncbi:MAG: phage head morphogenesis protein, partial [Burkholderiaceae bacterium]|nr:phage head morphogenesis protein [Burkholderiaceae bacterium]